MLYLNYAKPVNGGYILNFFADSEDDIKQISDGKEFVTRNGTNYGAPLASSTVVITMPDKAKKAYMLGEDGEWKAGSGYVVLESFPTNLDELDENTIYFIEGPYSIDTEDVYKRGPGVWQK